MIFHYLIYIKSSFFPHTINITSKNEIIQFLFINVLFDKMISLMGFFGHKLFHVISIPSPRKLNIIDAQTIDPEKTAKLAEQFSISEADITHLDRRITARDLSLNAPVSNSEEDSMEFIDILEDDTPSPEVLVARTQETEFRQKYLKDAMLQLSDRERHIFTERRLKEDPITLEKLGEHYGISRERIRQLENRAYTKVQTIIHSQLIADPAV